MIVCSCNVLSEAAVQTACHAANGPKTLGQVYRCLGCDPQCGRCARTLKTILDHSPRLASRTALCAPTVPCAIAPVETITQEAAE